LKDLRGHNIYVSTNDYYQQQCQSMINVNQQSVNQQSVNQQSVNQQLTAQQAKAG
jgi:hypothetical protein